MRAGLFAWATLFAATAGTAAEKRAPAAPTFTKDVAAILNANCVICHRSGDIAPMPLLTYEQVRPWSNAIKQAVLLRSMPPWFADPHYEKFRNDRRLSDTEIATLVAWVNAGSPKGDAKDLPPPPKFTEGWTYSRPPDLVVEMPLLAKIPATGQLDMQNYYVKVPFTEDKFVEAIELRPGNRAVVHHSIVNLASLPEGLPPEDLISGKKLGRTLWKLIGQAPGKGAESHHDGVAKRIAPGTYFEFNMHFTPTGKEETDRTLLGLWFAKGPVHHEVLTRAVSEELYLDGKRVSRGQLPKIPARESNWSIVGKMNVRDAITIYSLSPHMHFRGKDMKYTVTYPDGSGKVLLNVPNYNYNWQLNYELEEPVRVPAGSTINVLAHYDNSRNNPRNPDPDTDVIWGQQSWNEMFVPWMEYSVDRLDLTKLTREEIEQLSKAPVREP